MTRYKHTEFADEDTSSVGSIHLNEATSPAMHIRYHSVRTSSLWTSRTFIEKCLICLVLFLLVILFILAVILATDRGDSSKRILHVQPHSREEGPCLEESCIHAASSILHSIDQSIDPCDNFYAYSCNQWIKNNPIPDGKSMWGTFGKLEQQNQLVIKNVLERDFDEFKSKAELKAKLYYESCLDENEVMETLGAKPMLDLLEKIGGWNITKSGFNISTWSLETTLMKVQNEYNMGGLFGWAVGEDDRQSTRHVIQIDQGGLTLPTRDNYLNKTAHQKVLDAYLDYMTKVAVLLGANESDAKIQMQGVIDFETELAKITIPSEDRRDEEAMYHNMTLAELQDLAPFIDWRAHFDDAFRRAFKDNYSSATKKSRKITEKEHVVVYAPQYLHNLTNIIKKYQNTTEGKIVLNNYLVWQTVRSFTACLSKAFRDAYKGLRKALIGSDGGEEPWRYCVTDTNNAIGFAIGAMFVREAFNGKSKPQAEQMINEVRNAFKANLEHLDWMDDETRKLAEEKADAITDMIGYPSYILDAKQLDEKYRGLDIKNDTYFMNNIEINRYNLRKNLEKLDEPVNKTRWGMTPPTVNAYYTPTKNQIVFPAGILQLPFYDILNPKSLNFGGMGVVMGHEITHGFDDQGREYDKEGNLHQWWNNATISRFKKRTDCFEKQYSNYSINGRNLNGKQTLGENIADNGGLKAAFHAFKSTKRTDSRDTLLLPGVNLTHNQLFFVAFAQVWCTSATVETTNLQIEKDPHSPPEFRVIGSLSNFEEFAMEFNCARGSRMYPIDRCEVW
ncbi:endothelin-converting enzyme homolog isoform X2 [Culicoides brevitarsis]